MSQKNMQPNVGQYLW